MKSQMHQICSLINQSDKTVRKFYDTAKEVAEKMGVPFDGVEVMMFLTDHLDRDIVTAVLTESEDLGNFAERYYRLRDIKDQRGKK
jgi:hypothetical protein